MKKYDMKNGLKILRLRNRLDEVATRRGANVKYNGVGPHVSFPQGHPYEHHEYVPETEDQEHNTRRAIKFLENS
jgi:hypothetical protein